MQHMLSDATEYIKQKSKKKRWVKIVTCLASVVVFCTVYALILPAITMENEVYCEMDEHEHSEECYKRVLSCGLEENSETGHVHDESCYKNELICELTEHNHTLECYSDVSADLETAAIWEKTLPELSGDRGKDLIAVAESQIGYKESENNYIVAGEDEKKGYTRYGEWYGERYDDWSAMFVSFCLNYAEIPVSEFPQEGSCNLWMDSLANSDGLYCKQDCDLAEAGDLVFLDADQDGIADHAGIISAMETDAFQAVVGDWEDQVQKVRYYKNDPQILGYVKLPQKEADKPVAQSVEESEQIALYSLNDNQLPGGGNITITETRTAVWNDEENYISSFTYEVVSSTDKVTYRVEYSDDGGSTWNTAVTSAQTSRNVKATLDATPALADAPLSRIYRVYGGKDDKNYGYNDTASVYDLLDSIKEGFSEWLENSYVQFFGGTKLPETQEELYAAFAVYKALPTLTIDTRLEGGSMYIDAVTDGTGTYTYRWEYQNDAEEWVSLCEDTTASVVASNMEVLCDGGRVVRCQMYQDGQIQAISNTLFADPMRQIYDAAIEEINSGLNLGDLAINGTAFTDYFYYGNVAKDERVPFTDAQTYADYLAKTYLNAGGGEAGLAAVRTEWETYLYDIYDPTAKSNTVVYPEYTYGDTDLEWPKDSTSSFHGTLAPKIDDLNYNFLENGVDYSNFVTGLDKTAKTVAPGDDNTDRQYDIDITADAQAKAIGPVAMILQIQTSWQMFDLDHANAVQGDGYTQVGAVANNTELATLYDIKHALLRFVDYMEEHYPGNNLVLGITEVQHAKSQTMFSGTDQSGNSLYVTNNYDVLRQSIRDWDSFGNCEHVHYDTNALVNATKNLASNLAGWKDFYGEAIQYNDIQKTAVIIGGPTENSSSTNGYACTLPWTTFQGAGLNSVYSIRTNEGTSNGSGVISWLDYTGNNNGAAFNDGTGTTFTEKYVATTEDAVFQYLVRIAEKEMRKKGVDITAEDKFVENVKVEDTVSDEFILDTSEPIKAIIYNKDGSVAEEKTISPDDPNLTYTQNDDGTFSIGYLFGTVYNTKKCVLHFRIQAKEDYIGSNNVYSNVGTPGLDYEHSKVDNAGNLTGVVDQYSVECYDTPQINVPIRFETVDGDTANIIVGENVDLADLSTVIAQNAEDLVDNYDQINGTLSYTWELPDGTTVDAGSITVKKGSIGEQVFPDRSSIFTGTAAGQYKGTLKVTFTPEAADSTNKNFSNSDTAVAVNPLTRPGNVWINVVAEDSTTRFYVRKEWVGNPPEGTDSVTFRVLANGEPVTGADGEELHYELSEANDWETEVSGLQSLIGGQIMTYTVEELDPPDGYSVTYSSETRVDDNYAAKETLSFTPSKDQDKVVLQITYQYGSEIKTYVVPEKTKYKKDTTYSFTVDNLPLDDNGEPYACNILSIKNTDGDKPLEISSSNATGEIYLRESVNTEVKVITNAPAYELPKAGGMGTRLFTLGGLLLISVPLLYGYRLRRKRGRGAGR